MNRSTVHFLDISKIRELASALDAAGIGGVIAKNDLVALKLHFGEKGNVGYVKPEFIKPIIKKVKELGANPFITDANTIYKGERTDAVHHLMLAAAHDFHPKYLGAPVIIADGLRGNSEVEVEVGFKHFKKVKVAEAIYNADVIVSIAHFKGHILCGIGGAIKNIGMGCASRAGKYEQHNSVVPTVDTKLCTACGACVKWCGAGALTLTPRGVIASPKGEAIPRSGDCHGRPPPADSLAMTIHLDEKKCVGCGQCILACNSNVFSLPWNEGSAVVQEKVAEYACGILKNKKAFYINFLTFITSSCDCFKTTSKPLIPDIGILISTDPVAIDQASLDLIKKYAGRDVLKEATNVDGGLHIEHAERLGLGTRNYSLER